MPAWTLKNAFFLTEAGTVICSSDVAPSKASLPNSVKEGGKLISFKEVQSLKAIISTLSNSVFSSNETFSSDKHLQNEANPIVFNCEGNLISFNEEQL